ncbi:uncharacterized protein PHACADRAFT_172445 [Phanerochaete carnosa HHB-10118-sp]|uniref:EF-hand domain-containing protein n=1 Tax=Phanerochaete carnosa (strain HHB-10118-sp) TaxID=650164 RepID=K5WC31_PHACS|nr:uncharacterized protein PHACADRAFT_172445 [Phanerochaete carnosa HHB-10118-sp]EKM56765.1 hypothetical protein PHACADRAFT_172445 [Phanerochaete carnosa HHB-10118-sp]
MLRHLQRRFSRRGRSCRAARGSGESDGTPPSEPTLAADTPILASYESRSASEDDLCDSDHKTTPMETCASSLEILAASMPIPYPYPNHPTLKSDSEPSLSRLVPIAPQLDRGPLFSRAERVLDGQGERIDDLQPSSDTISDTTAAVQMLQKGIKTFMDDYHWFMKALDEVAKIHPFVAAAILAFKAVYSMERTRQENDKRIIALYVAMKDMIRVLVQLRTIEDPHHLGPDGVTIEGRLQSLVRQAAEDIKDCANACDTYSKKRLLVKVLKGPIWEARLAEHVARFHQLKKELKFALSIHTATTTEGMKLTLNAQNDNLVVLVSLLQSALHELKSPEEILMEAKVDERGGPLSVQHNDSALRELLEFDYSLESLRNKGIRRIWSAPNLQLDVDDAKLRPDMSERTMLNSAVVLNDVKDGLQEDWETALQRNMVVFQRKFALQRRLQEDLSAIIHEGNDRVIQELRTGPHDGIYDEELRELWREMGWKTNVPSNRFAVTLRDHFQNKSRHHGPFEETSNLSRDSWTTDFIELLYVQRIKEAFDEDGSGYVTVAEVNRFTEQQPRILGWSLRHWLAYWTIGWHISATWYRDKIRRIFARMFVLRRHVLPRNRSLVDNYLHQTWTDSAKIVESLQPAASILRHFDHKFIDYLSSEERRIRENLEGINYNLDAVETIVTVVGSGRVEGLFNLAQEQAMCEHVFAVSVNSLLHVHQIYSQRYQQISTLLLHRGLDVPQHIKRFSCELFEYYHDAIPMWKALRMQIDVDDETVDTHDPPPATELPGYLPSCQHVHQLLIPLPRVSGDSTRVQPREQGILTETGDIFGQWNGFVYSHTEYPIFLMTSFHARPSHSQEHHFEDHGTHFGATYRLLGLCSQTRNHLRVQFSIHYSQEFRSKYFSGYLKDEHTIVGSEGWTEDPKTHQYRFILKRIPAEVMCCRPSPSEFRQNRIAALWKYARSAIIYHVRKESCSKTFFAERREIRSTLIEFDIRNYTSYGRPLDQRERLLWTAKRGAITAEDAAFYRAMRDAQLALVPKHLGVECAGCTYQVRGARIICLDCLSPDGDYTNTVNFCDDMRCRSANIKQQRAGAILHHPSHDVVKVRTVQHLRDMYALEEVSRAALLSAKHVLKHSFAPGFSVDEESPVNGSIVEEYTQAKSKAQGPAISPVRKTLSGKSKRPVSPQRRQSHSTVACGVCAAGLDLLSSCWFCVNCFDEDCRFFICNDCEAGMLLPCATCNKPYKQLSWYHGSRPGAQPSITCDEPSLTNRFEEDSFACSACTALRDGALVSSRFPHSYTHALVQCKPAMLGSRASSVDDAGAYTSETAISELRQRVQQLDNRIEGLEEGQSRLEHMVGQILSKLAAMSSSVPSSTSSKDL